MTKYSPQQLLDLLHQLNIPALAYSQLPTPAFKDEVNLVKQKLRLLKHQLKRETDVIEARWDGRNAIQAQQKRLELAPYLEVERLIESLDVALSELEIRGAQGQQLRFGTTLAGNGDSLEWHILSLPDALLWQANDLKRLMILAQQNKVQFEKDIVTFRALPIKKECDKRRVAIECLVAGIVLFPIAAYFMNAGGDKSSLVSVFFIGGMLILMSLWIYNQGDDPKVLALIKDRRDRIKFIDEAIRSGRGEFEDLQRQHLAVTQPRLQ